MIEFVKRTNFDFVKTFRPCMVVSIIVVAISFVLALTRMNYGVDFRGGAEIQIKFAQSVHSDQLRSMLSDKGFKAAGVQTIGEESDNEFLVKVQGDEATLNQIAKAVEAALVEVFKDKNPEVRKVDIVGPKAGDTLRLSAIMAIFWAVIAIMIYIGVRFEFKYAPGAMLSLFHDAFIILGFFALTGLEFSLQTVAAILAIIGYSINDTVIVYDRIREHAESAPSIPMEIHMNKAINETLSRTIMTSGFTLIVCVIMMFLGGPVIRDFFIAMTVGIMIGTYSSVYVASASTLAVERIIRKNNKNAPASSTVNPTV